MFCKLAYIIINLANFNSFLPPLHTHTEVEVRALKLYSPNGPRNGVVLIFLTQSNKSLWTAKIGEMIEKCTPTDLSPSPVDLSPPTGRRHTRKLSLFTPPTSPPQTPPVVRNYKVAKFPFDSTIFMRVAYLLECQQLFELILCIRNIAIHSLAS